MKSLTGDGAEHAKVQGEGENTVCFLVAGAHMMRKVLYNL